MKHPWLFILFLLSIHVAAQDGTLDWYIQVGSENEDVAADVLVDDTGNVYLAGNIDGAVDFDPGPAQQLIVPSAFNRDDAYIVKYDWFGAFQWIYHITGKTLHINEMDQDAGGGITVVGTFNDSVDFDPGPGEEWLEATTSHDIFILRLEHNGKFAWVRHLEFSPAILEETRLSVDKYGNVVVSGLISVQVDLDPGPGVLLSSPPRSVDVFVCKLFANGYLDWAYSFGSAGIDLGCLSKTDDSGNVFLAGFFIDTIDFDPGPGSDLGFSELGAMYLTKLDAQGAYKKTIQVRGIDPHSLLLDEGGGFITTGSIWRGGKIDVDPGPDTFFVQNTGLSAAVVHKLDANGNFSWAKLFQTDLGHSYALETAQSSNGDLHVTGHFDGPTDVDPGEGQFLLIPKGYHLTGTNVHDIFLAKLDANGNLIWAGQMGGNSDDRVTSMTIDNADKIFLSGIAGSDADLHPGPREENLVNEGETDGFLVKLHGTTLSIDRRIDEMSRFNISPNPFNEWLTVESNSQADIMEVRVLNFSGQEVLQKRHYGAEPLSLHISGPSGIYLVHIHTDAGHWTYKIVKR